MPSELTDDSSTDRPVAGFKFDEDAGEYSDHEWETATERVVSTRQRVLAANPEAAEAAAKTYASISARVETLRAIRRARGLTQSQISTLLEISQAEVSRMERRTNLQLTTLARFIEAVGGRLRITAVFDEQEVEIGVGDLLPASD